MSVLKEKDDFLSSSFLRDSQGVWESVGRKKVLTLSTTSSTKSTPSGGGLDVTCWLRVVGSTDGWAWYHCWAAAIDCRETQNLVRWVPRQLSQVGKGVCVCAVQRSRLHPHTNHRVGSTREGLSPTLLSIKGRSLRPHLPLFLLLCPRKPPLPLKYRSPHYWLETRMLFSIDKSARLISYIVVNCWSKLRYGPNFGDLLNASS